MFLKSLLFLCFFIVQRSFIFFTPIMPWIHREWVPAAQAPFPWFLLYEVCFFGWNRPVLQLNPSTFLFGFLLFLIIFLPEFQEAISALRVLNTLNVDINCLGKDHALVWLRQCQQHARSHCRLFQSCHGNTGGAFHFERCPFPWCLQYHLSCRFACMWPKEQLHVF